jgi:hypothetical protein
VSPINRGTQYSNNAASLRELNEGKQTPFGVRAVMFLRGSAGGAKSDQ